MSVKESVDFAERVANCIRMQRLFNPEDKLLAALSGGADSLALALCLKRLGYAVEAAHCNFALRGDASDSDEDFVRKWCEKQQIPLHVKRFQTEAHAREKKVSIEMAARELRYEWFDFLAKTEGFCKIAVGHHREDNVETFFLNLSRGTGLRGLTGMQPVRGRIVRPLLTMSRKEIETFLLENGESWVTDASNFDVRYKRNRLRRRVLPEMELLNPSFMLAMEKTMQRLLHSERLLEEGLRSLEKRWATMTGEGMSIRTKGLSGEDFAPAFLYYELKKYGFSPEQAEEAFGRLDEQAGAVYESADFMLTRAAGSLEIRRKPQAQPPVILKKGLNDLSGGSLRYEEKEGAFVSKVRSMASLDASKVQGVLVARPVERGDRFSPFGMKGSRLVSDYLTDRKYSRIDKLKALAVADDLGILWLVNERVANRAAVGENTLKTICLEWRGR